MYLWKELYRAFAPTTAKYCLQNICASPMTQRSQRFICLAEQTAACKPRELWTSWPVYLSCPVSSEPVPCELMRPTLRRGGGEVFSHLASPGNYRRTFTWQRQPVLNPLCQKEIALLVIQDFFTAVLKQTTIWLYVSDHCASPKLTPGFMALLLTALVNKLLKGLPTQELYLSASQISSHKLYTLQPISSM